jgi:hypothetical protein
MHNDDIIEPGDIGSTVKINGRFYGIAEPPGGPGSCEDCVFYPYGARDQCEDPPFHCADRDLIFINVDQPRIK